MTSSAQGASRIGDEVMVDVGPVAHGGSCVARHEGRVVFVRHALPGERVQARITEGHDDDRYWRADAVEILRRSNDRVQAPCPYATPGGCGGCDWQHAALPAQRELKAAVVAEQLQRLAGVTWEVLVEPVPGDRDGLDWRTKVTYAVDTHGRAGLRRHRSHDVVPIERCLIAHPDVRDIGVEARRWGDATSVEAVVSGDGNKLVSVAGPTGTKPTPGLDPDVFLAKPGSTELTHAAAGQSWEVSNGGFWQVHPGAADALAAAVLDALAPRTGESVLDLYCGAGLFAGVLAEQVGPSGRVVGVESSRQAATDARRNLRNHRHARVVGGRVDTALKRGQVADNADIVILDPPRAGAKARVVSEIAQRSPRAVAYVACDPAALARDVATFATFGYDLTGLRAFDLFPMTHHVECVAVLEPSRH